MAFSPASRQAIESFARHLGLSPRAARDGSFSFVFSDQGTLTLTPADDDRRVVVSLARRRDRLDGDALGSALARAGFDPTLGLLLHAGLAPDESLVFSVHLDDTACDLPTLETCLQGLSAAHRSLG